MANDKQCAQTSAAEMVWSTVASAESTVPNTPAVGQSPCMNCVAPCCWNMKLSQLCIAQQEDLDYLHFLSGFPHLDLVYRGNGHVQFFYRAPCRHLDVSEGAFTCALHGTPQKPATCTDYDESDCYYRHGLLGTPETGLPVVRLDYARWSVAKSLFPVEASGRVSSLPSVAAVWKAVREVPVSRPVPSVRPTEPGAVHCEAMDPESTANPCEACAAPCCQALLFARRPPHTRKSLEFMRYQLGFPGVQIAVTPKGWWTVLRTSCAFFDVQARRCGLYGRAERPELCRTYDEHRCDYRRFFGIKERDVIHLAARDMAVVLNDVRVSRDGELPSPFGWDEVRQMLG